MEINVLITTIATVVAIFTSGGALYVALRKSGPEVNNILTDTLGKSLKTVKDYSELNDKCLEEKEEIIIKNSKEREELEKRHMEEMNELKEQFTTAINRISDLESSVKTLEETHYKEIREYQDYITELLSGIKQLTGQLAANRIPPVWEPKEMGK